MANATYEAQVGIEHSNPAAYLNIVGAVISLMVFLGIVGWGAKMIARDSSGVPVVRALNGAMRVSPVDPGGILASHQGLTVNEVASSQNKLPLEDRLQLAPRPINLQAEDQPTVILLAASALMTEASASAVIPHGSVASDPEFLLSTSSNIPNVPVNQAPSLMGSNLVINFDGLGPRQSPRPRMRSLISVDLPAKKSVTVVPPVIVHGRPMAQLGAFGSQTIAMHAWIKLSQQHENYLSEKQHIILKAEVGGVTIYRLRVHGFSDLAAARRFCSALNNQNTECYSVVMN